MAVAARRVDQSMLQDLLGERQVPLMKARSTEAHLAHGLLVGESGGFCELGIAFWRTRHGHRRNCPIPCHLTPMPYKGNMQQLRRCSSVFVAGKIASVLAPLGAFDSMIALIEQQKMMDHGKLTWERGAAGLLASPVLQ
jgi:hypothetical protein